MSDLEARLRAVEDQLAIANLRGLYCQLLDAREWEAFVDLFTEDGRFVGLAEVAGRADLMRFFSETVPNLGEGFWHYCTNGTIEVSGDQAAGRIMMEYLSVKDGISYVSGGHYDDELVRTEKGWRFKSRVITWYYYGPLRDGFVGQPPRIAPFADAPQS